MLPLDCAALMDTPLFQQIVRVESSGNAWAIGVVGGELIRQPRDLTEAVATSHALAQTKTNFSIGLAQVNRVHFARLGWNKDIRKGFDACANASAGAEIYNNCYRLAQRANGAQAAPQANVEGALSCYYSGDLHAGKRLGYVSKVLGTSASVPGDSGRRRVASMMLNDGDM